jgi:predicted ATPase/class 3 adenylate cyclase/DNA-binding CsgD family transcriptional regulator
MRDLPRGTVTLLFTDIAGSTHLLQQLGDHYLFVLAKYRQLLRDACCQWNGHEVDTQGDALLCVFARASDAASAAVAMQRAIAFHDWPNGATVHTRIGLHTGEPQLSAEGYFGLDVHHTARIMSAGHGGQILLSQTTRELMEYDLPEGVSLRDLGMYRLEDLHHKSHLFQLVIAGLPTDFPPLKTLDTHPNNLPIQLTQLIGREQEVASVLELLRREDVRLLTLTGPGGIGKTRLALQVAAELSDRFPNGVYFVNLAPLSDPELVIPAITQTFTLKEVGEEPLFNLLKAYLQEKQLLLLLDNFEQVVSAAVYVAELLASCPMLKVMVTSRAALHLRGEQECAVPPLAVPNSKRLPDLQALSQYGAAALFIQRAQAVKSEFQLTKANALAVAEICARLDGLPLAIELAAARVKLLPPQALLVRLSRRLQVLTGGVRDAPARQQTLRQTIEWSYQLLHAEDQRLFLRLSVFAGGCTLEAIEAVCAALDIESTSGQVLDGVASLLDKSLLQQTEQEGGVPRLSMLETVREYVLEAIEASGEMKVTRQAHAAYYLTFAEEVEPKLLSVEQQWWLGLLDQEYENVRAALLWSFEQGAFEITLRLGGALWRFWLIRVIGSYLSEELLWLEQAMQGIEGVSTSVRAKALMSVGLLASQRGENDRAESCCRESLVLFQELGDTYGIAYSLHMLGRIALYRGGYQAPQSLYEEALHLFRELDDKEGIAYSLTDLAYAAIDRGEFTLARSLAMEGLELFRLLGDKRGTVYVLLRLGRVYYFSQTEQATEFALGEEALAMSREIGYLWGVASAFGLLGQLELNQGDLRSARSHLEEALGLRREIGDGWGIAWGLYSLAWLAFEEGDYAAAKVLCLECLAILRELDDQEFVASGLEALAAVVSVQENPFGAARLWGAAETLRKAIGAPIAPVNLARYERLVAAARTQLGEKVFATAWAQGRTMTPDQVLTAQGQTLGFSSCRKGERTSAPPATSKVTYPDELSSREVEVLRLVAQGLTDAQIAEQLIISPRTVNSHLTSIYSKIGVTSRSAATRHAFEHRIV